MAQQEINYTELTPYQHAAADLFLALEELIESWPPQAGKTFMRKYMIQELIKRDPDVLID